MHMGADLDVESSVGHVSKGIFRLDGVGLEKRGKTWVETNGVERRVMSIRCRRLTDARGF